MKIHIKSNDGYGIKLWIPTSLLKSKFILKNIKKYGGIDIEPLMILLPKINKTLKAYIKKHGHFTLIDVRSSDGDKVIVKV
jgi:hypothetical protein